MAKQKVQRPGMTATLAGYPVDAISALLSTVGAPTSPKPLLGSKSIQSGFDITGDYIANALAPDPTQSVAVENIKGIGRGVQNVGGQALGLSPDNALVNAYYGAMGDVERSFTESVEEKRKREEEERDTANTLQQQDFLKSLEALNAAKSSFYNQQGGGGGEAIAPMNFAGGTDTSGEDLVRLEELRGQIAGAAPTPLAPEEETAGWIEMLGSAAAGAAGSGDMFGDVILGMAGGISRGKRQKSEKKRQEAKDFADEESAFAFKQADAELAINQMEQKIKSRGEAKVHNTGQGLVVESSTTGADGKVTKTLKPFTGTTFKNLSQTQKLLSGLGAKDVNILSLQKDIPAGDPLGEEQALLAALDQKGQLESVFADVIGSEGWNQIATDVQQNSMGESISGVQERIANLRIAYLANLINTDPTRQTEIYKLLGSE